MSRLAAGLAIAFLSTAAGASAGELNLRLAAGLTGPTETVTESARGTTTRYQLGGSPLLALTLIQRVGRYVSGYGDVAVAPMPVFQFSACFEFRQCDLAASVVESDAQTYRYTLGFEVAVPPRRVMPFTGADIGGITYGYRSFGRRRDTRLLWSVRAGFAVGVGRHALVAEVRRSTVSNPPFGNESFHPIEGRAGVQLRP